MILLKNILNELTSDETYGILLGVFDNMPEYVFNDFVMSDKGFFQKELKKIVINRGVVTKMSKPILLFSNKENNYKLTANKS